jgi:hypothetical protein
VDASSLDRNRNYLLLAEHVGVQLDEGGPDQGRNNIRHIRESLQRTEVPSLLVLDSLEEESGLWDLLPREAMCQVRF